MRPLILVSNDDSINASGVHSLISRLVNFGDVVAVCPDAPRSGQSMALTVTEPLWVTALPDFMGARMFKVSGTPVDCIKLAIHHLVPRRPDLVVAGINHGSNASINVLYSGTMGATMEGCAFGIPSIGFSLTDHDPNADFKQCFPVVDTMVDYTLRMGLPPEVCLNVNIPAQGHVPPEMHAAVGCRAHWTEEYREYTDPHGRKFYFLTGDFVNEEPENMKTDLWCLDHGFASVVPVAVNRSGSCVPGVEWLEEAAKAYAKNTGNENF